MEITNITVSYSKKISHKLYGGGEFEMSDRYAQASAEVEPETDVLEKAKELREICKLEVQRAIEEEITSFQGGGVTPSEFYKFLYDYVAGRVKDVEHFNDMRDRLSPAHRGIIETIRKARATAKRDSKKVQAKK